jgi:hypothetical protein
MKGRPTSGRHAKRMIESAWGWCRQRQGRQRDREGAPKNGDRESKEKASRKKSMPHQWWGGGFYGPHTLRDCGVSLRGLPPPLEKRPAQAQQPNVYLEPKWLR